MIAPYKEQLDREMNTVLVVSAQEMVKGQPESLLGNFVSDLILEAARQYDPETDFVLLNNGGLRTALPKGEILTGKIFELMPFDNEIVILTLSGAQVEKLCAYVVAIGGQPVSGITIRFRTDENGKNQFQRAEIGESSFDKEKTYRVATSDYLANGGDNMSFFLENENVQTTGLKIRDAIIQHLQKMGASGTELKLQLDGRITQAD